MGTIWRDLSKPPQRRQVPILVPSDCYSELFKSLDLISLPDGRSLPYSGGCLYIFLIYCFYQFTCLCNNFYGLSSLVGCWSSAIIRRIIYKFLNVCPFVTRLLRLVERLVSRKPVEPQQLGGYRCPNWPSWVGPQSLCNRSFGGVFVLSRCFLDFSAGVGAFIIGLSQISSFFSWNRNNSYCLCTPEKSRYFHSCCLIKGLKMSGVLVVQRWNYCSD